MENQQKEIDGYRLLADFSRNNRANEEMMDFLVNQAIALTTKVKELEQKIIELTNMPKQA
jgi:hypothetical protein